MTIADEIATLDASLQRRYRVVETTELLRGRSLTILHPASAEELIDEQDFERDERLPYWAELWPSSCILGEEVLGLDGNGRTLLELGCGAGLVTTCAAIAGFDVTASDYYEDATLFARVNAWHNAQADVRARHLDWRNIENVGEFDVVIASDVLYERPYGELVAKVIGATLGTGGVAYLADPGRVGREPFLAALPGAGLSVNSVGALPYVNGVIRQTITIYELRRTNSARDR